MVDSINKRISDLRGRLRLSQTAFGIYIEASQSTVSNLETEGFTVQKHYLGHMEKAFNVNPEWLRDGIGDMGKVSLPVDREKTPPQNDGHKEPIVIQEPLQRIIEETTEPLFTRENLAKIYSMVGTVLTSNTHYAESLDKNIFSFFSAVKNEEALTKRLNEQDKRIAELERIVRDLRMGKDVNPLDFPASGSFTRTEPKDRKKS
jgi:transcriptional regulator with XRE-family HTH domain